MVIKTKYNGEIDLKEHPTILFPDAIPGFPDEKEFVLIPFAEGTPFKILQSIKDVQVAFVTTSPFVFFYDYDFELTEQTLDLLEIGDNKDVDVYSILTVQEPFEETTANLKAPIILNIKKNLGKQLVLQNSKYETKHLVIQKPSVDQKEG